MNKSGKHYAPASRPSAEDSSFQEPLNRASDAQFKGMVGDLIKTSRSRPEPKTSEATETTN